MCLQLAMLGDLANFPPATVVLLTGDGAGYRRKVGFHTTQCGRRGGRLKSSLGRAIDFELVMHLVPLQ